MTATGYNKSTHCRQVVDLYASTYGALLPGDAFEEDFPCSQSVASHKAQGQSSKQKS